MEMIRIERVAVCCSVLQCGAVCCSVLQCVAVQTHNNTHLDLFHSHALRICKSLHSPQRKLMAVLSRWLDGGARGRGAEEHVRKM